VEQQEEKNKLERNKSNTNEEMQKKKRVRFATENSEQAAQPQISSPVINFTTNCNGEL